VAVIASMVVINSVFIGNPSLTILETAYAKVSEKLRSSRGAQCHGSQHHGNREAER